MNIDNVKLSEKFGTYCLYELVQDNINGYIVTDNNICVAFETKYSHAKMFFNNLVEDKISGMTIYKTKLTDSLNFIEKLGNDLKEINTEISDILIQFLENGNTNYKDDLPSRFIKTKIPNSKIEVEYDTCTTLIAYRDRTVVPAYWWNIDNYRYLKNDADEKEREEYNAN